MIDKKEVLGIIPARGGSKGVPRKNIRELAGKPLIAWTIEEGKKFIIFNRKKFIEQKKANFPEILEWSKPFLNRLNLT